MQDVLAVTLASMHQDMSRLDHVALNLANVSTPGYKREVVSARPFSEVMQELAFADHDIPASATTTSPGLTTSAMSVLLDNRPGSLKQTGEPLDVALTGDGFFEVNTDTGTAYTRQGNFRVDARGRLVTAQGFPVMGKNGEIILATQTPFIDTAGNITEPNATTGPSAVAPGTPVAQIKIVRFDDIKTAQRIGDGLMTSDGSVTVVNETEPQLRQGNLENSNVSAMHEMVQLIQTMRHFESVQKVTQGYDEMVGTAIRKLGDLS